MWLSKLEIIIPVELELIFDSSHTKIYTDKMI